MLIASGIIATVRKTTLDSAANAYSNADLIRFLNEAQRSAAGEKPDFYTVTTGMALVTGENQTLPDDGVSLLDVTSNTVANGGRVVTLVQRELLAEASRFWPRGTRQTEVEHYTFDPRTPRDFKVFPPNDGAGGVQIIYGAVPPEITATTDELVVSDVYEGPLVAYVLAKCYGVSSKKQDLVKYNGYMMQFRQQLGLKTKGQFVVAPKVADVGEAS
jgi:hypothetical protein